MKRELTYFAPRKCYKKKRNGQTYYVGKGSDRDSDDNYRRAWGEWEAKLTELVAAERRPYLTIDRNPGPDGGHLVTIHGGLGEQTAAIMRRTQAEGPTLQPAELDHLLGAAAPKRQKQGKTLAELADEFLARKATQARTAQRSVGRYANLRSYVNQFRDFAGADKVHTDFTPGGWLARWHERQLEEIDAGEVSTTTASDRMQAARQFLRWLWEQSWIDLPRNLDSRDLTISRTQGNPQPMPVDALRRRVTAAAGRLKLELLLMANCGMYQKDCADLLHTQVDWAAGTITRKRSKTKKHENVPTVTYYLWPSTAALLKRHASQDTPNVLINRNGVAGVRSEIRKDGTVSRTDNTASAYGRLQTALAEQYAKELPDLSADGIKARTATGELETGEDGRPTMRRWPAMTIRKTGATAIGNHRDYSRYAEYYLGEAPQTVADTHYVKPSEEQFRECCAWLGRHLGIDTLEAVEGTQDEPASADELQAARPAELAAQA